MINLKNVFGELNMKKLALIIFGVLILSAFCGVCSANSEIDIPIDDAPHGRIDVGYIQVFCNVENATVLYTGYGNGGYEQRAVNTINGLAEIGMDINRIKKVTLNITADGYYPLNITNVTMPKKRYEIINITVNLEPLPTPTQTQSPMPIMGILSGLTFCGLLSFLKIRGGKE